MMSYRERLESIGTALAAAVPNTYHYCRPNLQPPFCIWAEESGNGFTADNKTAEHALTGTVDYFSKQEYDPAPDAIESTLSGLGLIWELNSVQYEDETELIHHEWTWSMR